MQKITPFLWFDDNAEEAINFYKSIFKDAQVINERRMGDKLFTSTIQLEGQEFMLLNAGPMFTFTPAISFFVKCADQMEVDYYWYKLIEGGGSEERCGWLKDRFGLSWQIIPNALGHYLGGADTDGRQRAMQAMMKMNKIIVDDLKAAYEGETL
jgi:predicted 3-demethylubiquinone-9 3-methyltransferase (glyoxalase superfamily)